MRHITSYNERGHSQLSIIFIATHFGGFICSTDQESIKRLRLGTIHFVQRTDHQCLVLQLNPNSLSSSQNPFLFAFQDQHTIIFSTIIVNLNDYVNSIKMLYKQHFMSIKLQFHCRLHKNFTGVTFDEKNEQMEK